MALLNREAVGKMEDPQWLIPGVLPAGEVSMIYGASGRGKSFCVVDMACSIATGHKWAGRTVQPGAVVYVAGEGKNGYKARLEAWEKQHNSYAGDFYLWPERVRLWRDPDSVRDFIDEVAGAKIQPALVVLDPLGTCLGGADENSNTEMREVLGSAEDIARALGAAVLLVHHTGKSGETARGAQALQDGVSMQSYFTSIANPPTRGVLTCRKQKNGEPFDSIGRAVHKVSLGPRDACLAFSDEHQSGPRDQNHERVTWADIRAFMAQEDGEVTPTLVGKALAISKQAAYNHLNRGVERGEARQTGGGGYVLNVYAKVA